MRLGDVAKVKYGKAKPKDLGNIPVVGSGGIYASTTKALVDYPTIVIGRKGTAGKAWLFCYMSLNPPSGEHAKTTLPSLQKPDLENFWDQFLLGHNIHSHTIHPAFR